MGDPKVEEDATAVDRLPTRPAFETTTEERTLERLKEPASVEEPTLNVPPEAPTVTRTVDTKALRLDPTLPSPLGIEPAPVPEPPPPDDEDEEEATVPPPPMSRPVERTAILAPTAVSARPKPVRPFAPGLKAIEDDDEDEEGTNTVTGRVPVLVDASVEPPRRQRTKTARMISPPVAKAKAPAGTPPVHDDEPVVIPVERRRTGWVVLAAVVVLVGGYGVSRLLRGNPRAKAEASAPAVDAPRASIPEPVPVDSTPVTSSAAPAASSAAPPRHHHHGKPSGSGIVRDAPF